MQKTTSYPNLLKLGFSDFLTEPVKFCQVKDLKAVNIGAVLELNRLKEYFGYTNNELLKWLLQLKTDSTTKDSQRKDSKLKIANLLKYYKQKYTLLNKSKTEKAKLSLDIFLRTPLDYNHLFSSYCHRQPANIEPQITETTKSKSEEHFKAATESLKDTVSYWKNESKKLTIRNKELTVEISRGRKTCKEMSTLKKQLKITEKSKKFIEVKYRGENKRLREKVRYYERLSRKFKQQLQKSQTEAQEIFRQLENQIDNYDKNLKIKETELQNLKDEVLDLENKEISFTEECRNGKYTYTANTDICVMKLLDSHVPFEHVEKVISSVLDLCNLTVKDSLPKKDYVAKVNARRLALGQIHIADSVGKSENCTLYSDETRKSGQSFGTFVVTNENREPMLLGLRHMSSKSSKTELDTFKTILEDVQQRCQSLSPHHDATVRLNILQKITSTMSDRAATEISFKEMLQTYRSDLMKDHIENFDQMSPEEQHILTRMFNFFCGLHLLVNIAETMNEIFKQWEYTHLGTMPSESGILRTVRNVSKAFARGADNKNGAYLEFLTYMKRKGVHNIEIKSFLGNRFNIVFHNGGVIYHLRDCIIAFLEDVKSDGNPLSINRLLHSILSDLKVTEYTAGLKALGIFNKFITAPLWKILDSKSTHILDMNKYYGDLVDYLEAIATDVKKAGELLTGEYIPFSMEPKTDAIWATLVSKSSHDTLTISLLMQMCAGVCKLLKEKVRDHLYGGKYYDVGDNHDVLNSVLPHNKLPEWVFGYLDWLLKHRPNATRLANEAHILFQVNRTGVWLKQKSEEEIRKLMEWSKNILPSIRQKEKLRIKQLNEELEKISKEKEERAKAKKERDRKEKEKLIQNILQEGLWESRAEVNRRLQGCSKKQSKDKIKVQIKFRQRVLQQDAKKDLFLLTRCAGQILSVDKLKENLCLLIDMAHAENGSVEE